MKKFFITESERKHIKSLYITEGILNEGIPGLSSAVKVGMKQGLGDASKAELKKMIQKSFPRENVDDVYKKFETEFASSKNPDKVIEKYFKGAQDDMLEDFCRILAKESPSKFSRYSLDVISTPETSRVIRYAVEHPEKYTLEQLEKIDGGYRDILETLDDTDPFTLEVKNNLETQYGDKLKQNIESKKGTSSQSSGKQGDRPINDSDFNFNFQNASESDFETKIASYLPPNNKWDSMGDKFGSVPVANRATSEYVRELNKLDKKINAFNGQIDNNVELFTDFIQAYTSTKIARDLNAKQLERMYSNLSRKLNPEQASVLKQLADVSNGTAKLSDIKFKNPKLNAFVQALAQQGDSLIGVTRSSIRAIQKTGKYAGEWLVAGIILYIVLSNLSDALGGGSSSKPKKQLRSRYED